MDDSFGATLFFVQPESSWSWIWPAYAVLVSFGTEVIDCLFIIFCFKITQVAMYSDGDSAREVGEQQLLGKDPNREGADWAHCLFNSDAKVSKITGSII